MERSYLPLQRALPLCALLMMLSLLALACGEDANSTNTENSINNVNNTDITSDTNGSTHNTNADTQTETNFPTPECVPDEQSFQNNILPIIQEKCGSCHGEPPEFGAPFSLYDYDALVAGPDGERQVDAFLQKISDGSMPPAGNEWPSHSEFDSLVLWASCGLAHPDYSAGLVSSAEILTAPDNPPEGTTSIEFTAGEYLVGLDAIDLYKDFYFDSPVEEDFFIQRIEPIIDESRVIHHITFHYDNPGDDRYLYAWAPGTGAVEFPEGGLRIRSTDRFHVEIHYNNAAAIPDAHDSSGIRLWIGPPTGTEYSMVDPSTWAIIIPPMGEFVAGADCIANEDHIIFAGMPHMHGTGETFSTKLERADGSIESLVEISGWSFELQYFYSFPTEVSAGDKLKIRCGYYNPNRGLVSAGPGTEQEMCFNFMYVTPPTTHYNCSDRPNPED